jgi:bleomycin hydrolase
MKIEKINIVVAVLITFIFFSCKSFSQNKSTFTIVKKIETTPLKDQQSSGTCWSFATTSFIETEALRLGKKPVSLSPIFYVHPTYIAKAEKYIAKKGESWFDAGDLTFSVIDSYKQFGAVPETVYNGVIEGDWQHDHVEMDNLLYEMVKSIGTSGYGRIKPNSWKTSVASVLDSYLGKAPTSFEYEGKTYTPKSFAEENIGINPNDYIEVTSYSHHNFYEYFVLDIPANWNQNNYLNVTIKDFESIIDNALNNGYSLAWDGDATEPNFDFEKGTLELTESGEKISITQKQRQTTFEDKTTTDDHNMHIIGIAKNNVGKTFYMMKNSEGDNDQQGFIYMSKNALLLKTISVLVNKEAIPSSIRKRIK